MTRAAELPLRLDTKMFLISEEEDSKIDVFEVYGLSNSTTTVRKGLFRQINIVFFPTFPRSHRLATAPNTPVLGKVLLAPAIRRSTYGSGGGTSLEFTW